MEMNMVDAASGGALVNMTPQQARDLIPIMAANSQQFRANPEPPRRVHQLSNSTIEDRLDRLTNIVNSLVIEKSKPARVCGICTTPEHTTNACLSLCDDSMANLEAVGNFPGPPQRRYDPYANTYNPGWRDHPNFSYGANPRYNRPYQNWAPQQSQDSGNSLETLETAITNRTKSETECKCSIVTKQKGPGTSSSQESWSRIAQETLENDEQIRAKPPLPKIQPLLPGRLNQCRKSKEDKDILETFRNVEINLPLLDAIGQIPQYAKFLKELCTNKRKLTGNEKIGVTIQLADRSIVHPEGVLEDVLVKVNGLIFPANFYVIKMEEDNTPGSSNILLG
ncbi:uncharacterized protein [Gossypium hirsutum]|uniref:Retrotransposon gag protein n=1 Tax=Gossypium hirsutum TaxID=3635 RepID=A0A1U8P8R7_GOSHI|nr:uncharacterized protein LOC107956447 [Gossypium hirsutum]